MLKEEGDYHLILKKEIEKKQKELNEEEMKKINQYNQMMNEKRIKEEETKKQKLIKAQEENKNIAELKKINDQKQKVLESIRDKEDIEKQISKELTSFNFR